MAKKKVGLSEHGERGHALLSASGSHRWMNCTPSAILERDYGEKSTSVYAEEGTLAHELAELYLRRDVLADISDADFDAALGEAMDSELFSEEMLTAVPLYTRYCGEQFAEAQGTCKFAHIELEQKLDLSDYVPGSFGTADCLIISDGVLEVIDLKYGKGVRVEAEWNPQLMLYGLGALAKYSLAYDIDDVRLTIVQPRLDSISSWQISVADLQEWAEKELGPAARKAADGEGDLCAGEWCRFCSVKHRCRALYEQQMEMVREDFGKQPDLLTDEEIADVVLKASDFTKWVDSVVAYAEGKAAEEGKQWPGLKLVEGVSRRKWADEAAAGKAIAERLPELSLDQIYKMTLQPITTFEKVLGKARFASELSDLTVRAQGRPTLVPLSDKRQAFGAAQAAADFAD